MALGIATAPFEARAPWLGAPESAVVRSFPAFRAGHTVLRRPLASFRGDGFFEATAPHRVCHPGRIYPPSIDLAAGRLEIYDHNPTIPIFIGTVGPAGRFVDVHWQLDTRLHCFRLPPLCLFAPANLLDDERG